MRYRLFLLVLILACTVNAAVQRGTVKAGGLPIPGATVTATQGDHKEITSTDETGSYVFENLAPGAWTIEVEMFGFAKASREVQVAEDSAALQWDLRLKQPRAETAPAAVSKPAATPATASAQPAAPAAAVSKAAPAAQSASAAPPAGPASGNAGGTEFGTHEPGCGSYRAESGRLPAHRCQSDLAERACC